MMLTTERHGEVIADLSAEGPRLREAEMMRIARDGAAKKAGLRRNEAKMLLVAEAAWFG